jgi:hypothetical protein
MFNSSDLKNSNNTLYAFRGEDRTEHWYVVRDIGSALGTTGRFAPRKNDPGAFERAEYIAGVNDSGYVDFAYAGFHQELVRSRIRPADVRWASELLGRLSEGQWQDAFRAGGYEPDAAARFIGKLRASVTAGQRIGTAADVGTENED